VNQTIKIVEYFNFYPSVVHTYNKTACQFSQRKQFELYQSHRTNHLSTSNQF